MAYNSVSSLFKGICDAIREKDGTTGVINHQDIPKRIQQIVTNNLDGEVIDSLHAWSKYQPQILETEESNVLFTYSTLTGSTTNGVKYSDEIKVVDGKLSLVNPITGTWSLDTCLGKYLYSEYKNGYYRVPSDAKKYSYNNSPYSSGGGVVSAYKLSVGEDKGERINNAYSLNRDDYPDDDKQGYYWYLYIGKVGELLT